MVRFYNLETSFADESRQENKELKQYKTAVFRLKPLNHVKSNGNSKGTVPKIVVHTDSSQSVVSENTFVHEHSRRSGNNNTISQHFPSPTHIVDASDALMDPVLYEGYFERFTAEDTISERLCNHLGNLKDKIRDKTVNSVSASEKAVYLVFNRLKYLSKRWYTHVFLMLVLFAYSALGATVFMFLEGPNEVNYDKKIVDIRKAMSEKIEKIAKNETIMKINPDFFALIEGDLIAYEDSYSEYLKHVNNNNSTQKTWTFWNSMFFAGTIYTTIADELPDQRHPWTFATLVSQLPAKKVGVKPLPLRSGSPTMQQNISPKHIRRHFTCSRSLGMSEDDSESDTQSIRILVPKLQTDTPPSHQVNESGSPVEENSAEMEDSMQKQSLRKRRNLSKNRAQATRQREKTPEPSRTHVLHEDTTSDDEDMTPLRTSREIEADDTYEEMKRLVEEQAKSPDPVYDLDTEEILEARAMAATERRRRSISPFAIPDKDKEKEEGSSLERKGSFIDPTNKLLSTKYVLSKKDEDTSRRDSLSRESLPTENKKSRLSLSPPITNPSSPVDKEVPFPLPSTPKKLEELVYPDEKKMAEKPTKPKTPVKTENLSFEDKDQKQNVQSGIKETPVSTGDIVTKVIELERTPSKRMLPEQKPVVEVRERIVRTPSRKLSSADIKPVLAKQIPNKPVREDIQSKVPPVKPARSKSASRFGGKTSESEMSEDQIYQQNNSVSGPKRKVVPTPRRFIKNRSPRANRSHSINRFDIPAVIDNTGTGISQTSREIIEMMQKARARSLSIPKDDPRLPSEYKKYSKVLQTPNKTPTTLRNTRGISCPKTIHIISEKEILAGLSDKPKADPKHDKHIKHSRHSSGYIDASQSEYTSSCYSTSPSENEYDFDLSVKTDELTRKLNMLSHEVDKREHLNNVILASDESKDVVEEITQKSVLRKRSIADTKVVKRKSLDNSDDKKIEAKPTVIQKEKKATKSRWKILANWQQFKEEYRVDCERIRLLRNKCICDTLLLIIFCGLGGMLFKTLEGSFENAYKCGSRGVKRDFIESLWRGSHYLREEDWKSMARKKLFEFENQLHSAHEAGVTSYSGQRSWNFMNSFVYCLTLITTIGYGHISPKTTSGRVATIVYAIIGIPLFLLVLTDFGKLLTRIIKFFWAYIRRFYYTRSCRKVRRTAPVQEVMKGLNIVVDVVRRPSQIFGDDEIIVDKLEETLPPPIERKSSDVPPPLPPKPGTPRDIENETEPGTPAPSVFEVDDEFNLPITLAIFILILYIIFGAVIINIWESWDFFESFYFVFISMSTIGLGDLVPNHPMYMMSSILYLVFGLALTSMCINVVQLKLSDTFRQASVKLGATIGLTVAEEDGSLVPIGAAPVEIVPVHKPKSELIESINKDNIENDANNR